MTLTPFLATMTATASPEVRYNLVVGTGNDEDNGEGDGTVKNNGKTTMEMLQLVDGMDATKTGNSRLYLYIAASAGQCFLFFGLWVWTSWMEVFVYKIHC